MIPGVRYCRDCHVDVGPWVKRCEPCRLEHRAKAAQGWASRRCRTCGGPARGKGGTCIGCAGEARRRLVPCPRCGAEFWPWAGDVDHGRKYCTSCVPRTKRRTPAEVEADRAAQLQAKAERAARKLTTEQKRQRAIEKAKIYYRQNKAKVKARLGAYRRRARANPSFKAKERACIKRWARRHPDKLREMRRAHRLSREARKRSAFVEHVKPSVVYERDCGMCGICGLPVRRDEGWHIDHVIPLSKGGEHSYRNVQLAHAACNVAKGDTMGPPPTPHPNGSRPASYGAGGTAAGHPQRQD